MDPFTILAAFAPAIVEAGKALVNRFIAADTFKPANIAEWAQMQTAEVDLFKAMNDTGKGPTFPLVEAVIKLQRPIAVALVTGTWVFLQVQGGTNAGVADNAAAAVWFYLFGDRTLFHARQAGRGNNGR